MKKTKIKLDDMERRILVKLLYEKRNELIRVGAIRMPFIRNPFLFGQTKCVFNRRIVFVAYDLRATDLLNFIHLV